jgi:hypothetical protein
MEVTDGGSGGRLIGSRSSETVTTMVEKHGSALKNARHTTLPQVDVALDDRESDLLTSSTNENESDLEVVTRRTNMRDESIMMTTHDMSGKGLANERERRMLRLKKGRRSIARLGPARRQRDQSS